MYPSPYLLAISRKKNSLIKMILTCLYLSLSICLHAENNRITMIALGDSITTATNAGGWGNQKKYSWATGFAASKVQSHLWHLRQLFPEQEVEAHNLAIPGSLSSKLEKQVKKVIDLEIDYATLMIGSNDVCYWKDQYEEKISKFQENIYKTVEILIDKNPEIKILLLPIPDLYHLWEISPKNRCQWRWNVLRLCHPLLGSKKTKQERLDFKNRVTRVNEHIEEVADDYPQHILFLSELNNFKFSREHISSRDCFHPSVKGQNLLAQISWQNGWFHDELIFLRN